MGYPISGCKYDYPILNELIPTPTVGELYCGRSLRQQNDISWPVLKGITNAATKVKTNAKCLTRMQPVDVMIKLIVRWLLSFNNGLLLNIKAL